MKTDAGEYLVAPGADPRRAAAERRKLLADFRSRARAALKERWISRGAFAFLDWLLGWAKEFGDGNSFSLAERLMAREAYLCRESIACFRWQLARVGLIRFEPKWAHKRGWYYETRWTLLLSPATGLVFRPATGLESGPATGLEIRRPLIRKRVEAPLRLYASREDLPQGQGSSSGCADGNEPVGSRKPGARNGPCLRTDGRKRASEELPRAAAAAKEAMGLMRRALGPEFPNDAGKWGKRAHHPKGAVHVRRVAAEIEQQHRTGKPFRIGPAAAAENLWQRWKCEEAMK